MQLSPFGCFVLLTNLIEYKIIIETLVRYGQIQIDPDFLYSARLSGCSDDPPRINVLCGNCDAASKHLIDLVQRTGIKRLLHHHCQK